MQRLRMGIGGCNAARERFSNLHLAGVEPTTYGFGGRHSIQLSYRCEKRSINTVIRRPDSIRDVGRNCNPENGLAEKSRTNRCARLAAPL